MAHIFKGFLIINWKRLKQIVRKQILKIRFFWDNPKITFFWSVFWSFYWSFFWSFFEALLFETFMKHYRCKSGDFGVLFFRYFLTKFGTLGGGPLNPSLSPLEPPPLWLQKEISRFRKADTLEKPIRCKN